MAVETKRAKTYNLVMAIILITLLLVHITLAVFWGGKLERKFTRMRAEGQPVTPADLTGPPVPDPLNAAVVYGKAIELLAAQPVSVDSKLCSRVLSPEDEPVKPEDWKKVRQIVKSYRQVYPLLEEAQLRPACSFPINWKAGLEVEFSHHKPLRSLSYILAADAVLQAKDGNCDEALRLINLNLFRGASI